jgi:hypothetical protein
MPSIPSAPRLRAVRAEIGRDSPVPAAGGARAGAAPPMELEASIGPFSRLLDGQVS